MRFERLEMGSGGGEMGCDLRGWMRLDRMGRYEDGLRSSERGAGVERVTGRWLRAYVSVCARAWVRE